MAVTGNISVSSDVRVLLVKSPTILNSPITLANTEYTITIPQTAKRISLKSQLGRVKLRYVSTGPYLTIHNGTTYSEENLGLIASLSLYIESTKPNDVIEIIYWE